MNANQAQNARALVHGIDSNEAAPLCSSYDGLLVDLDGTLLRGSECIPGGPEALARIDLPISYVTNNASKAPAEVADMLTSLGYEADVSQVMTSSMAAVAMAVDSMPKGTTALVVGAPAFATLAEEAGFHVTENADEKPDLVLQGLSKQLTWSELAEGALAIRSGARWIASNTDTTLPTERGFLPGNGAFVKALEVSTARVPEVAGKPGAEILQRAAKSIGSERPLVIGDRLDTDIAGACAAGMHSLLVLTGVSTEADATAAGPESRPTFVAAGLESLDLPVAHEK